MGVDHCVRAGDVCVSVRLRGIVNQVTFRDRKVEIK